MDGKFLDVYNEVVLENFYAVLKQNFMFQTQLKFAEENTKKVGELEKKLATLASENADANILREEIKKLIPSVADKTTQIKLAEVVTLLHPLDKTQNVKDENIVSLLQYYQLIEELKSAK